MYLTILRWLCWFCVTSYIKYNKVNTTQIMFVWIPERAEKNYLFLFLCVCGHNKMSNTA